MDPMKSARPISGRPLTSARSMTNTGLIAPKSARGKTALRRQIQDKSYFIGLLRSKINEISNEKNLLLKECDIMAKEEARISVYRQKAETLAKELSDVNLSLLTFNEFMDRIRTGDDIEGIKRDTTEVKHENEALIANLENEFLKLKSYENLANKNEEELQVNQQNLNNIKNMFTQEQSAEFNDIQKMNILLSKECQDFEEEISLWKKKKSDIEQKTNEEENFLKINILQSVGKVRHLEKQKHELLNSDNTEENERGHLLAQVKRDNNYITTLTAKIEECQKEFEEVKNEIDFYQDEEKMVKITDLKQKENSYEEFVTTFNSDKERWLGKVESVNNEVNDFSNKLARCLKYLGILKQITDVSTGTYNILNELIIQKRKLELELYQNQQNKAKMEAEKEMLSSKISKLQESINSYSDISKLKAQVESKLSNTKKQTEKASQEVMQMNLEKDGLNSEIRDIHLEKERNLAIVEIKQLEQKLREILRVNTTLKSKDNSEMMNELKKQVIENTKKYNQNLIGF